MINKFISDEKNSIYLKDLHKKEMKSEAIKQKNKLLISKNSAIKAYNKPSSNPNEKESQVDKDFEYAVKMQLYDAIIYIYIYIYI